MMIEEDLEEEVEVKAEDARRHPTRGTADPQESRGQQREVALAMTDSRERK